MLARFARASRAAAAGAGHVGVSAAAATAARRAAATALSSSAAASRAAAAAVGGVRQFQTGDNAVLNRFKNPAADPKTGRILALNTLKPAPSARKRAIMLGRGEGTHFGKSAGRGMRGTYHRRALHKRNFEGGQTPLHRRIPKRGHHVSPRFQERFREVSLAQLQHMAETGRIDATRPIQLKDLFACGFKPKRDGIKIIGLGAHKLVFPLHVEVSRIDELAKFAIEQAGGSVKLVYFTRLGMRAHLYPEKFAILPAATNIPPPKKRHIYLPYDTAGAIPPLLWKSRLAASSPLAKFWTPSPRATRYLEAEQLRQQAMAAAAGGAKAAAPSAKASTKAAN